MTADLGKEQARAGERQPGERQPGERQPGDRHRRFPAAAGRLAAGWWAAVMVAGLAIAPEVMRRRVSSGGWHAALQPCPWLTAAPLTLAALYALLAEGTAVATARNALCALTGATTVPAAALAGAVALVLACIGRRRTGARPSPGRNRDPE